jgi:hypothetical protein
MRNPVSVSPDPPTNLWAWDPERNIIRWSWVRHGVYRDRYRRAARDPANGHLEFVVLSSRSDVDRFLASVA